MSSGENTEENKKVKKKAENTPTEDAFLAPCFCVIVYRKGKKWQTQGSLEQQDGKHLQWAGT